MADFNFVTARLATGAAISSAADVDQLAGAGITLVIDCRGEFDDAPLLAGHPSMVYVWDGTDDDGQPKPPAWFDKGISLALSELAKPGQRVYCHCAAGVNRGPSMAYAVMRALGWSAEDGEAAIRRARPQVGLRYKADADAAIVALGYG
jgi:dual specificity phosphatase 3